MRLTFVVLYACWTIYSSSSAVLSLPPSLIVNAASLQQQRPIAKPKRESFVAAAPAHFGTTLWHKDDAALASTEDDAIGRDVVRPPTTNTNSNNDNGNVVHFNTNNSNNNNNNNHNNNENSMHQQRTGSRMSELASDGNAAQLDSRIALQRKLVEAMNAANAGVYDLNGYLQASAAAAAAATDDVDARDGIAGGTQSMIEEAMPVLLPPQKTTARDANEFFTPLKYWARHCQPGKNCPKQYYRALFANRNGNKAVATLGHRNQLGLGYRPKTLGGVEVGGTTTSAAVNFHETPDDDIRQSLMEYYDDAGSVQKMNDDIFMFLNGEQDLMKFLRWAMRLLYPHERFANYTANDAEYYHPGMYIWKKLNLSGNLEPPLFVEEPHYIIVRREQLTDDLKMNSNYNNDDPFIPPRGRKQNMPDLDSLLHRYETFVPNRGKRDKIKDMLKSDDLFFPNRGKKLKPPKPMSTTTTAMKRDFEYEGSSNGNININSNRINGKNAAVDITSYEEDWNTALPVVLVMRDLLGKLFQWKLQKLKNHRPFNAVGNKITTNAHEINYADDNNNNNNDHLDWLNYKFNGNDPSVRQSMPTAVAINGVTSEMSTPQKAAAQSHALLQLLRNVVKTAATDATTSAAATNADIDGVDSGGTKIGANRLLLSTRSMSTVTMAQRRQQLKQLQHRQQQQQQQRQQQRQLLQQQQRRLAAMSQQFDADNNLEHANWQQHPPHSSTHQVKSFNNFDPLLWRQLQFQKQQQLQQQPTDSIQHLRPYQPYPDKRQPQQGSWPQESFDWVRSQVQSDGNDGVYTDFAATGNVAANNDYNYFDI